MESFNSAFIALMANKVRSFLTMLGIIIGVAAVILLVSIGSGLQAFVTKQFASLGSNTLYVMPGKIDLSQGFSGARSAGMAISKFETGDVNKLMKVGLPIKRVTPMTVGSGVLSYKGKTYSTQVAGIWTVYFEIGNFTPQFGRLFTKSEEENNAKVVVLGSKPAGEIFGKNINLTGKAITINEIKYQVVGILESKGGGGFGSNIDDHTYIPFSTSLRLFNQTRPYMIYIEAGDQKTVEEASILAEKTLLKRLKKDDFTVLKQTELLSTINQFLGVVTSALGGIASISLLVGGIGIMNIMLVSVTERTREIGLRKAVGATEKVILLQFLIEALVLSLVGGFIGISLGAFGSFVVGKFVETSITLWSIIVAFAVSSIVGIVFGVFPAYRASKLSPIEALRYE